MSKLEKKRPGESPEESGEAKRLKVFNEKMALVGFGKGQTENSPSSSRESSQGSPVAPVQNTQFQPPVQASFGQPQCPTWNTGAPAPSTNTFTRNGPDLSLGHAHPSVAGRLEDRSLRDIILSILQEIQPPQQIHQPRETQLIRQPASTQAPTAAYSAASQGGTHTVNTALTTRKSKPPVFVEKLHLKIKTEVSPLEATIEYINAVNQSHAIPSNILSPVAGFAEGTYIGVISDTNRSAIIAATEMALNECKLPTKQSWFLTGPAVKGPKSHEYSSVLLRSNVDPEDEEKRFRMLARRSNRDIAEILGMWERITTLEMENQQLRERNQQLEEDIQELEGTPSDVAF